MCGLPVLGPRYSCSGVLLLFLLFIYPSANGYACDPNENCRRCLVSAFGKCHHRGNDPACEARKKACQVPVVGPIITGPGSPFGPGGVLGPGGPGIGPVTGEQLKGCFANPPGCPGQILSSFAYQQMAGIVDQYIAYLRGQGHGRWKRLPDEIVLAVQQRYPMTDLRAVMYAENINTVHGQHITIGNEIYFTRNIDLQDYDDLELMFHELEHVLQYARRGGIRQFLAEYILKVPSLVISRRSFSVHDEHDIEQAANAKAATVIIGYAGRQISFHNSCTHPVRMAISYKRHNSETWRTTGYWDFDPNKGDTLDDDEAPIWTKNSIFYFSAESIDGSNIKWGNSDTRYTVDTDSKTHDFKMVDDRSGHRQFRAHISCPGK
jgi:hypothetical protein